MFDKIYQHQWITLSADTRTFLAKALNIPSTGIREIRDDVVVSDGHTNQDLSVITSELLEEYVGSKEEFPRLWELTLAKARYEMNPPIQIIPTAEVRIVGDEVKELEEVKEENKDESIKEAKKSK